MNSVTFGSVHLDHGCTWKQNGLKGSVLPKVGKRNSSMLFVRASVVSPSQTFSSTDQGSKKYSETVRVGVLGASGYTGSEIVRLLANHPNFKITLMTADRKAGQSLGSVFPHLITQELPKMIAVKDGNFSEVDAVFCCLPHGTTQEIIKGLPSGIKIVDLSADFRLRNIDEYEEWYGQPHRAPELQEKGIKFSEMVQPNGRIGQVFFFDPDGKVGKMALYATSWAIREVQKLVLDPRFDSDVRAEDNIFTSLVVDNLEKIRGLVFYFGSYQSKTSKEAVYGLTEILREDIRHARLVANPGCYPTSIQLPLVPLLKARLIEVRNIIIDAKSGVSGAGRGAKEANLYTEIAEGIHSYGITKHRHVPEIEQGLSDVSSSKVVVSFTPHLMPMSRGMQSTIYVEMASGVKTEDLYQCLSSYYENEEFVVLLEKGAIPHTRNVRGSNYCFMNVFDDRITGRAIIVSVIDNLVKGASGQALQNLNLMM